MRSTERKTRKRERERERERKQSEDFTDKYGKALYLVPFFSLFFLFYIM